jgi:hypothetical protein
MKKKKRLGTVGLWATGLVLLAADYTDKLQKVVTLIPDWLQTWMPPAYGVILVSALLMLRSAQKDDLEELEEKYRTTKPELLTLEPPEIAADYDQVWKSRTFTTRYTRHFAYAVVRVHGTLDDVTIRIDRVEPKPPKCFLPVVVRPRDQQPVFHEGHRVHFLLADSVWRATVGTVSTVTPAIVVASAFDVYPNDEGYRIWLTAVATGSAPAEQQLHLNVNPFRLRVVGEEGEGEQQNPQQDWPGEDDSQSG